MKREDVSLSSAILALGSRGRVRAPALIDIPTVDQAEGLFFHASSGLCADTAAGWLAGWLAGIETDEGRRRVGVRDRTIQIGGSKRRIAFTAQRFDQTNMGIAAFNRSIQAGHRSQPAHSAGRNRACSKPRWQYIPSVFAYAFSKQVRPVRDAGSTSPTTRKPRHGILISRSHQAPAFVRQSAASSRRAGLGLPDAILSCLVLPLR